MPSTVTDIRIDECLWERSMVQEGVLSGWAVADGVIVEAGQGVATVLIEETPVVIRAGTRGRLSQIAHLNAVLEPGDIIGRIAPT